VRPGYYRPGITRLVWGALLLTALVGALVAYVLWREDAAFDRGRKTAADGVVFDSLVIERAAIRAAKAMAHTDTVTQRVLVTRYRVDTLITQLPPAVAEVPEVKALVTAVQTLTVQVDSLTTAHTAERAAWTEKARVDSSAIYALRIIGTAQRDTITTLTKRPKWRTVVVGTLAGLATGFVAGGIK
jgi:hypothetical protein